MPKLVNLHNLHNVFHVSQLRRYIHDPSHVIAADTVRLKDNLTFEALPKRIEDQRIKQLRGKELPLVKVIWSGATEESATWELESKMKELYPQLFVSGTLNFEDEILYKGEGIVTPSVLLALCVAFILACFYIN